MGLHPGGAPACQIDEQEVGAILGQIMAPFVPDVVFD